MCLFFLGCVIVESRDRRTHQDLRWADRQNGENRLRERHSLRVSRTATPCACTQPRSSPRPLCQPRTTETASVQMSKVTSCIQLHYLWPESWRILYVLIFVLVGTLLCVCGHGVLFAFFCPSGACCASVRPASEQQPACDSIWIPSSLTAKFPAAPGWRHAGGVVIRLHLGVYRWALTRIVLY